jgi:hypothetical protein
MKIRVIGPRDPRETAVINTTSRAGWSSQLSPFLLGPVRLYEGIISQTMENAWQYSKVYKYHVGRDGEPTADWWAWAENGWMSARAVRYPMGKGARPEFSYWDGEHLGYVAARRKIYVPLYAKAVVKTAAFRRLQKMYVGGGPLVLWDFDGYDYLKAGKSLDDVLDDSTRSMGHAFVLAMLLEAHPVVSKYV